MSKSPSEYYIDNSATSCTNLVYFGPVTPEITRVECAIFAATRPKFTDPPSFGVLVYRNGLQYRNSDFSILIGDIFCTSCGKMVRFGSVTLKFMTLECVQQVVHFTGVS